MNPQFWAGKRVFLTGHTGFKGSWLSLWLQSMGAHVTGFALAPPTTPSLFEVARVADGMQSIIGDVRDLASLQKAMNDAKPEIVIHMAAQALVRYSYLAPVEGIDFQGKKAFHRTDGRNLIAYCDTENLPDVGCRVGADKQHPFTVIGKLHGSCTCNGGFADASLSSEEKEAWRLLEKYHSKFDCGQQQFRSEQQLFAGLAASGGRMLIQEASSVRLGYRPNKIIAPSRRISGKPSSAECSRNALTI